MRLEVAWKTGAARGRRSISTDLMFVLADGTPGRTGVELQADIVPDVLYKPEKITFREEEPGKQRIEFEPGRQRFVAIKGAVASHRAFKVSVIGDMSIEVEYDPCMWRAGDDAVPVVTVLNNSRNESQLAVPLTMIRGE